MTPQDRVIGKQPLGHRSKPPPPPKPSRPHRLFAMPLQMHDRSIRISPNCLTQKGSQSGWVESPGPTAAIKVRGSTKEVRQAFTPFTGCPCSLVFSPRRHAPTTQCLPTTGASNAAGFIVTMTIRPLDKFQSSRRLSHWLRSELHPLCESELSFGRCFPGTRRSSTPVGKHRMQSDENTEQPRGQIPKTYGV